MTPVVSSTIKAVEAGLIKLTAENVFFVLLDVVHNGACDLNFGKKVEISQNEENLCLLLELVASVILKHKQVPFLCDILSNTCLDLWVLNIEV
jgi:hypothetical protein